MDLATVRTILEIGGVVVLVYNTYHTLNVKNIILELQLNLRREFNGRYQTIDGAKLEKERLDRIEARLNK